MSIGLPSYRVEAGELLQHASRTNYRNAALFYGRNGQNRYDAPTRLYGVLYLGLDLATALMESVFHKHQWDRDDKRSISLNEVRSRLVRAVGVLEALVLADLTAEGVMAGYFGLNAEQLVSRDSTHTQQVSAQVHALPGGDGFPRFDGVLYPSRNNYPGSAIALFDRAQEKVKVIADIDLADHTEWPRFVEQYRIGVEPDPDPVAEES